MTAACQAAPPMSPKEEIVLHEWSVLDSFGKEQGSLSFSDGKMNLHANVSDENFKMTEECLMDDKKIVVNSEEWGVVEMDYTLSGEWLELTYCGKKITLRKKPQND